MKHYTRHKFIHSVDQPHLFDTRNKSSENDTKHMIIHAGDKP